MKFSELKMRLYFLAAEHAQAAGTIAIVMVCTVIAILGLAHISCLPVEYAEVVR